MGRKVIGRMGPPGRPPVQLGSREPKTLQVFQLAERGARCYPCFFTRVPPWPLHSRTCSHERHRRAKPTGGDMSRITDGDDLRPTGPPGELATLQVLDKLKSF